MSKIDEILKRYSLEQRDYYDLTTSDVRNFANITKSTEHTKAQLLQLVLEVIGNTPIETRGTTQNPTNEKYWTKATTVRQKLIDEQRKRAYEYFTD